MMESDAVVAPADSCLRSSIKNGLEILTVTVERLSTRDRALLTTR